MTTPKFPAYFLELLEGVQQKRARTVIDHILKYGQITTQELKDRYGYNHPPRAARDVREQGIPLETFKVEGADGRRIAAYRFGDPALARRGVLLGRTAFGSSLKAALVERFGARCHLYCTPFPERELQIDHRVPFEIAGEAAAEEQAHQVDAYMLLCGSANRAKSWSCEHCPNWQAKEAAVCRTCYWAYPEEYEHIATRPIRRLDVVWEGDESVDYETLRTLAGSREDLPEFVKSVLRAHLQAQGLRRDGRT